MNSDIILSNELFDELENNQVYIAFFVNNDACYWVIDWDEHFNLDYSGNIESLCSNPELMRYLPAGKSIEEYRSDRYEIYRGGITKLTVDKLPEYLNSVATRVMDKNSLSEMIHSEIFGDIEKLQSTMNVFNLHGQPPITTAEYIQLQSIRKLLPTYYVNFNRKLFMHMRSHRLHETQVHEGWKGERGDFEHLIPMQYRYWVKSSGIDYWSINNFVEI